jgi:DNA (cytosine-5)-methyltransferase 1
MRFLSVCSGIEAASVAWGPLGWRAVAFSEIEPFPCSVLAHHYPDTPNWGDMTQYKDWPDVSIDLLCGGTPCQSFSVAGLRKGLDDPRGNLMLTFGAIAAKYRPQWLVWENVPGVLSSNGGADFGSFLGMLGQLGYGFAYRVLDAQYFGVAQRRRRVFVVGCLGDWRSAAAVLFERHSLQGHPAPSRQTGQVVTPTIRAGAANGGAGHGARSGDSKDELIVPVARSLRGQPNASNREDSDTYIPVIGTLCVATGQAGAEISAEISPTLNCNHEAPYAMYQTAHTLRGEGFDASEDGTGRGTPIVPCIAFPERMSGTQCASTENLAPSMGALNPTAVAVSLRGREGGATAEMGDEVGNCLRASGGGGDKAHVLASMAVRRLTPMECERLQGFPDGYTDVLHRNKPAADGPRYKALGNSWAVPNVRWIGERIQAVALIEPAQAAINNVAVLETV